MSNSGQRRQSPSGWPCLISCIDSSCQGRLSYRCVSASLWASHMSGSPSACLAEARLFAAALDKIPSCRGSLGMSSSCWVFHAWKFVDWTRTVSKRLSTCWAAVWHIHAWLSSLSDHINRNSKHSRLRALLPWWTLEGLVQCSPYFWHQFARWGMAPLWKICEGSPCR